VKEDSWMNHLQSEMQHY